MRNEKGRGNICSDCGESVDLDLRGFDGLSKGNYADIHCAVCHECITSGALPSRPDNATEQLCVILDEGVDAALPALTTASGQEEDTRSPVPGVKVSRVPEGARYTVVMTVLDGQLKRRLENIFVTFSERGGVRYNAERFEADDGAVFFEFRAVV